MLFLIFLVVAVQTQFWPLFLTGTGNSSVHTNSDSSTLEICVHKVVLCCRRVDVFSSDNLQQETLFVLPAVRQMSQLRPRPLSRSLASIIWISELVLTGGVGFICILPCFPSCCWSSCTFKHTHDSFHLLFSEVIPSVV